MDTKIHILEGGESIFSFINACSNILLRNKSINLKKKTNY